MSARDKLNEASFFLEKLKDSRSLQEQRYFFGAFVAAWRSVTFVLQKDYRGRFEDKFDRWYKEKRDLLRKTESAGTFLKLRTILQKEGNKYPQLVIEAHTVDGDVIGFVWDQAQEALIRFFVEYAESRIFPVIEGEDLKKKILEYLPKLPNLLSKITEHNQLFCIGDDYQAISFERLIDLCKTNLDAVSVVVDEAEKVFGRPGNWQALNNAL